MKRSRTLAAVAAAMLAAAACGPRGEAPPAETGGPARRARAQDAQQPLLHRHGERRPGGGQAPGREPHRAGGRARGGRRQADADHREPDPDGGEGAHRDAVRIEGDRPRHRQGQPGRHQGGGGGHARRSAGRQGCRHPRRHLHRLGQLRGREDRRPVPGRGDRGQGHRRHIGGDPRPRDGGPAAARLPRRDQGREGREGRRLPDRQLGTGPGLHGVPEHARGASRHRCRVLRERHDGAGGGRGHRGQGQDGQDQGRRLRRRRRRQEGHRRGHDPRLRRPVPIRDGPRGRRERGQAAEGPDRAGGAARAHRSRDQGPSGGRRPARERRGDHGASGVCAWD